MKGTNFDYFSEQGKQTFYEKEFIVSKLSDRMGMRLEGPKIENIVNTNIKSEGLIKGVIQVPADGNPIIMLSDHGTLLVAIQKLVLSQVLIMIDWYKWHQDQK